MYDRKQYFLNQFFYGHFFEQISLVRWTISTGPKVKENINLGFICVMSNLAEHVRFRAPVPIVKTIPVFTKIQRNARRRVHVDKLMMLIF